MATPVDDLGFVPITAENDLGFEPLDDGLGFKPLPEQPSTPPPAALPPPTAVSVSEPNPLARVARGLARGVTQMAASVPEDIAVAATKLADVTGLRMGQPETPQESNLYKLGQGIRDLVPPETAGQPSFFTDTLPQAFGTGIASIAGGVVGKLAKVPALISTAGLGAAATAAEGYRDAIDKGANEDTAFQSFLLNAGLGLTEAVPFARLVNRLSGATGGEFKRQLIRNAGRAGLEEAVQETIQQTGSNKIAQALYDPERPLFNDVPEGAAAGGIVGFTLGLLAEAIGGRRARVATPEREPDATIRQRISEALPVEEPPGDSAEVGERGEAPPAQEEAPPVATQPVAPQEAPPISPVTPRAGTPRRRAPSQRTTRAKPPEPEPPTTLYRGEGDNLGFSAVPNVQWWSEDKDIASQFGNVRTTSIDPDVKVLRLRNPPGVDPFQNKSGWDELQRIATKYGIPFNRKTAMASSGEELFSGSVLLEEDYSERGKTIDGPALLDAIRKEGFKVVHTDNIEGEASMVLDPKSFTKPSVETKPEPPAPVPETPAPTAETVPPVAETLDAPVEGIGSIYQSTLNGQPVWLVQESTKRGFGDSIWKSSAEAVGQSKNLLRRETERAESLKREEVRKAEEAAAAKEKADFGGFEQGKTPMQVGRLVTALSDKQVNWNGIVSSRRDAIRRLVESGRTVEVAPSGKRRLIDANGNFFGEDQTSKLGMDYAEYLISKRASPVTPATPAVPAPATPVAPAVAPALTPPAEETEVTTTQRQGETPVGEDTPEDLRAEIESQQSGSGPLTDTERVELNELRIAKEDRGKLGVLNQTRLDHLESREALQTPEPPKADTVKEPWQMTRTEYAKSAEPNVIPIQFDPLDAIDKNNNRRPYNPDVITETAIKELKGSGFITGTKNLKLTEKGRNQLDEWRRDVRDNGLVSGEASDNHIELVEKAVREGKPVPAEVLADYPDLKPPVKEPTTPTAVESVATVLNTAKDVALTVPEGATFIRVVTATGKRAVVPIASVKKGNVLQGAGPFVSVEAGIRDRKGEFKPVAGEVTATPPVPKAAQSIGPTVDNPIAEPAAIQAVNQVLGTSELPSNITFTNEPDAEHKGRVTFAPGQLPQIEINLAKHDSPDSVKDTLIHELVHPRQADPAMARAVDAVAKLVSDTDRARKAALGYNADETQVEATNELIRQFYAEHANSNIFQRAVTSVIIAAKRLFGIDLTARQAAVALVRDAVKNHVAASEGQALSHDPTEVGDESEIGSGTEGVFTKAFGQRYKVQDRPTLSNSDRVLGGDYTRSVFDSIGLPTVENANHTRMLTPEAMATENEAAGQELLAKTAFLFNNINQLFEENNERAGVEGTFLNSLRNIIGTMKERRLNGEPVPFSEQLQNDLEVIAQSRASFMGMLLNSLRGMSDSILWTARNAAITLRSMRYESFGGSAAEQFVNQVRQEFKAEMTPEATEKLVKDTGLTDAVHNVVPEATEATVVKAAQTALETPVKNVTEFGQAFADAVAEETGTPSSPQVADAFQKATAEPVKKALRKARATAESKMTKLAKRILSPRTPLWRRLNKLINDGNLDFHEAIEHVAQQKGWPIPTAEAISKIKALVEREQSLRTLSKSETDRIEALPEGDRDAAREKAQAELEAATRTERADIIKRINTTWSKWTKPTSWNVIGTIWKSLQGDETARQIAQNNAQAVNEWITANILLKVGFIVRQTIDVGVQTISHDPTRALGSSMLAHKDETARGVFTPAFWNDAGAALATTWKLRARTIRHGISAGRQGLRGRGLIKHSEQVSHRLDIFDRMMETADRLANEGKAVQSFALRLVTYVRGGFLFSRAMDLLSTTGAEYAEIALRIRSAMKASGKSNAEISQQLDLIFGDMTTQFIEAYSRAQQIFAEKGSSPDKVDLDEAAWNIVRSRAFAALKIIDKDAQNFQDVAEEMANTIGWNEREVTGVGGFVGSIVRGVQRTGEQFGVPLAGVSAFGNAIAIGINRKLTWMGLGKLAQGSGENPWYRTELDREQRLAEGFIGAGLSAFMMFLVMSGAIVVRGFWPRDEKEKEKWRIDGRRAGVIEIPGEDGTFRTISLSVGPLALLAPAIVTAGQIRHLIDEQSEKQVKANEEAAKRGVTAAEVEGISTSDMVDVAANAFYASLVNSRTIGGFIGSFQDQGIGNTKKFASSQVSGVVPGLPAHQDAMRAVGVYMNPRLATFGDMLVPLPSSGARRVNVLGDDSSNMDKIKQIVQSLTGGTYPFVIDPGVNKNAPAYAALFHANYVPAPPQPGRGYVIRGQWRPFTGSELREFVPLRGRLFANEMRQVSGDIMSLPQPAARKVAESAFRRANDAALRRVGVDVEASKIQPVRSSPTPSRQPDRPSQFISSPSAPSRSASRLRVSRPRRPRLRGRTTRIRRPRARSIRLPRSTTRLPNIRSRRRSRLRYA